MSNLAAEVFVNNADGTFGATITGGLAPYTYSLDGGPYKPATLALGSYFASESSLSVGAHSLTIRDSAIVPQSVVVAGILKQLDAQASCSNTGSGNAQGVIQISIGGTAAGWYTNTVRVDGAPLGSSQTGRESILVFLANGQYRVTLYDDLDNIVESQDVDILCGSATPLSIDNITPTDSVSAAGQDGTATASLTDGMGTGPSFSVETHLGDGNWVAATPVSAEKFTAIYTGLAAGQHTLYARDNANLFSGVVQRNFTIARKRPGCTDPAANNYDPTATEDNGTCAYTPPPRNAHFVLSPALSLRFVQPGAVELPAFDNQLLGDEKPLDTTNPGYCQLVERADTLVLQYQSNYDGAATVKVLPCGGGAAALSVVPVRVVQGAGQSPLFEAYARPDTQARRLRIYFNSDTLPFPFQPGNRVTLAGAGSLSNTYPIVDVREDPAAMVPYLVLPVAYPTGAQRIDLQLSTPYALQKFDTWQAVLPFASVPEGCYQVKISVTDSVFGTSEAVSEPLDVATRHPYSLVVVYRNFDNGFNLNYTTGLVNRLRVLARFYERKTTTQKDVLRESTGRLVLLAAEVQRKILFEAPLLPGWLHEKLAVAFSHDFVRVDDLPVIAEEGYEYQATPNYTLSKGTILLEQIDFLGAGNRDDLGDVDAGNATALLANNTILTVNP